MKTRKLADVIAHDGYTLTVIRTDEPGNNFRVYKEWSDPAGYEKDENGEYTKWIAPKHHKELIERYADYTSALYLIYRILANRITL